MATSRTGTARWKAIVRQVKREAQAAGITRCPRCRTSLNYTTPHLPNSVEVDHITPHAAGGRDSKDNARVLCRTCNRQLGAYLSHAKRGLKPRTPGKVPRATGTNGVAW